MYKCVWFVVCQWFLTKKKTISKRRTKAFEWIKPFIKYVDEQSKRKRNGKILIDMQNGSECNGESGEEAIELFVDI